MKRLSFLIIAVIASALSTAANAQSMKLNDLGYFEARGTNVLMYNNIYNGGSMTKNSLAWRLSSAATASPPAAESV